MTNYKAVAASLRACTDPQKRHPADVIDELVRLAGEWRDQHSRELRAANERVTELEKLVYVPGAWRCAKCKCGLVSNTLYVSTGSIAANNAPQACPNGCGPMWRVTERDSGNELCDRLEAMTHELAAAREQFNQETETK